SSDLRALELQKPLLDRMCEAEQPGVQRLARKGGDLCAGRPDPGERSPGSCAIDRVADHRMAEMGEVNPDLVGPTGGEAAFDLRRMEVEGALDPISGDRGFPFSLGDDRHLFA